MIQATVEDKYLFNMSVSAAPIAAIDSSLRDRGTDRAIPHFETKSIAWADKRTPERGPLSATSNPCSFGKDSQICYEQTRVASVGNAGQI